MLNTRKQYQRDEETQVGQEVRKVFEGDRDIEHHSEEFLINPSLSCGRRIGYGTTKIWKISKKWEQVQYQESSWWYCLNPAIFGRPKKHKYRSKVRLKAIYSMFGSSLEQKFVYNFIEALLLLLGQKENPTSFAKPHLQCFEIYSLWRQDYCESHLDEQEGANPSLGLRNWYKWTRLEKIVQDVWIFEKHAVDEHPRNRIGPLYLQRNCRLVWRQDRGFLLTHGRRHLHLFYEDPRFSKLVGFWKIAWLHRRKQ